MSSSVLDILSSAPLTYLICGIIACLLYWQLAAGPAQNDNNQNRNAAAAQRERNRTTTAAARGAAQRTQPSQQQQQPQPDSELITLLQDHTRLPPHMTPSSSKYMDRGGIAVLQEGLLPFRHTKAAAYEQSRPSDVIQKNRTDRAKLLSRLLSWSNPASGSSSSSTPPARGSTIVICIPVTNLNCSKQRRVLYLLATFFNVLVVFIVEEPTSDAQVEEFVQSLRGSPEDTDDWLPDDVLPRHRLVAAQSVTGRVAFVRQLGRVEMVLDVDQEMQSQLSRFGFRVLVYGQQQDNKEKSESLLGQAFLS